jgi:hypothetical protein
MKTTAFSAATAVALACSTVHAQIPLSGPQEKMQVHTPESMAKDAEKAAENSKGKSKPKFVNNESPTPGSAVPALDPAAPNTAEGRYMPKWLLLRNGRMLFGEVLKDTAGYLYQYHGARMRFSLTEVEAVTDTKSDIYRYKKNRIAPNDLEERLELARWCLQHSLVEEAKTETKSVLAAAPDHARAKKLLNNLQSNKPPMMTQQEQKHAQGGASLAGEAAGFGDEAIDQFTDRVQLILINKCGKCHCNSRHESDFKLSNRTRITPSVTKTNFRAAELMVDLNSPGRSKLLEMAITPHGGPKVTEAGFGGPNDPSYKTLRTWVFTLSKSWHEAFADPEGMPQIAKDDIPFPTRRPTTTPPPQKQVAKMKSPAEKPGFSAAAADDAPPQRPSLMNAPKKAAKAPPKAEGDPLDPNDFNRSEGGQPAPTSKPADPPNTEKSSGESTPAKDVFKDVYGDLPDSWKKK